MSVRYALLVAALLALTSCRGQRPPRDYQNEPPAMTHPPHSATQTPTAHGMKGPSPEPATGVEGKNITRQPTSPVPPQPKLKDQPPANATTRT